MASNEKRYSKWSRLPKRKEKVQEKIKAENGGHKRANGHNDEGHDEHEEDNGSQ